MLRKELERRLETLNEEFKQKHIEPKKRPIEFISRYSIEFNQPIPMSSNFAKSIFEWFEKRAKKGTYNIGGLYASAYYYDAQFWELSIPIFYGKVELNSLNSLNNMPDIVKENFLNTDKQKMDYIAFWTDCLDYGVGILELQRKTDIDEFGKKLLMVANEELQSATSSLLNQPIQKRAILNCRMAIETSLKAYIGLKKGLTKKEAKSFGHNLCRLLDEIIKISGNENLNLFRHRLKNLPNIESRYQEQTLTLLELWNGYVLAQSINSLVVRDFTGHNSFSTMLD